MREIKFRAWHKKEKIMSDEISLFDDNVFINFGHNIFGYEDDVKIMQYTGQKDKNGVEIYEGDIIQAQDGIWSVLIDNLEDGVVLENEIREEVSSQFFSNQYCLRETKVIGNTYENPELLNKQANEGKTR